MKSFIKSSVHKNVVHSLIPLLTLASSLVSLSHCLISPLFFLFSLYLFLSTHTSYLSLSHVPVLPLHFLIFCPHFLCSHPFVTFRFPWPSFLKIFWYFCFISSSVSNPSRLSVLPLSLLFHILFNTPTPFPHPLSSESLSKDRHGVLKDSLCIFFSNI